ncbi:hypothetical protein THAOC_33806, partial [Thalassiosira oceanica]
LTAAVIATLVSVLVERRDQVRRLFFPALRRGRADFRISEKGKIGCVALSSDDCIGNGCGQTNSDDDSETPTNCPNDNEDSKKRGGIRNPVSLPRNHTGEGRRAGAGRRLGKTTAAVPREHPPPSGRGKIPGGIYDTAALGVLEALGSEERDGHVEYVFDGVSGCCLGVSFAMQTVNEALEEMTREKAGEDKDALAARAKRLAAVEGRLTKQERRATKAKKRSGNTPLRGPNSQYTMRWKG